jgi:glycosyltransferase involved in cell wall biosynthesis
VTAPATSLLSWVATALACAITLTLVGALAWWIRRARSKHVWIWITRVPPRTGGERYCCEIAEELADRGVACRAMELKLWRRLRSLLHIGAALESLLLAPVLVWCKGPFVVDENFSGALLVTNWLRALVGHDGPVILVHHMDRYQSGSSSRWSAFWQRLRLAPARRLIAVSDYTRREICSLGFPAERVTVVAPGCDAANAPAAGRPIRAAVVGPCRLLCVAPSRPRKGLSVLLEALAHLSRRDIHLTVVGTYDTDHYRDQLAPLIARHRLESTVEFAGFVPRETLSRRYADSDVLVCPSLQEGFGIVVAEALQAGLPVIASDVSALPELVEHGRNGLLFPVGDSAALAAAIAALADDPAFRASLRRGGAASFTWPRCRREFVDAAAGELLPPAVARLSGPPSHPASAP